MGRSVTLGNGRDIDKDIELCRTTNEKTSEQTIHVLMENHIPFTKSWINIPDGYPLQKASCRKQLLMKSPWFPE